MINAKMLEKMPTAETFDVDELLKKIDQQIVVGNMDGIITEVPYNPSLTKELRKKLESFGYTVLVDFGGYTNGKPIYNFVISWKRNQAL